MRLIIYNPSSSFNKSKVFNLNISPCPTIMAGGICGDNRSHYYLEEHQTNMKNKKSDKPPYIIPSMIEINKTRPNGYKAISTFSGAGGSSLGYKMAGFKVLWANEFIQSAREVYGLNFPKTTIDPNDIRTLKPKDILSAIRMKKGELDLMDGSPPCASFSMAGNRDENWGMVRKYSETTQRTDDLFFEFARLVKGIQPRVFVAENVSGLVKGVAKGYFLEILQELKNCGYNVKAKLLDAKWLGVPQSRQRIFFIGVRNDIGLEPAFPKPLNYYYSVRDAIPWVVQHGTAPPHKDWVKAKRDIESTMVNSGKNPSPTIIQSGPNKGAGFIESKDVKFVEDTGGEWGAGDISDRPAPTVRQGGTGHLYVEVETDITNYAIGKEWDKLGPGEASEKYFSLVKPSLDQPSPTVTQTGRITGAAAVVHPTEKRKFSIAELRRICAFPDDFILTGSYSQQWERMGRAVPPVMMFHIATAIRDQVLKVADG